MRVGGQRHNPTAFTSDKGTVSIVWWMGGPQGRFERVRKTSPTPEFDPQTVEPEASRYTDWAIPTKR